MHRTAPHRTAPQSTEPHRTDPPTDDCPRRAEDPRRFAGADTAAHRFAGAAAKDRPRAANSDTKDRPRAANTKVRTLAAKLTTQDRPRAVNEDSGDRRCRSGANSPELPTHAGAVAHEGGDRPPTNSRNTTVTAPTFVAQTLIERQEELIALLDSTLSDDEVHNPPIQSSGGGWNDISEELHSQAQLQSPSLSQLPIDILQDIPIDILQIASRYGLVNPQIGGIAISTPKCPSAFVTNDLGGEQRDDASIKLTQDATVCDPKSNVCDSKFNPPNLNYNALEANSNSCVYNNLLAEPSSPTYLCSTTSTYHYNNLLGELYEAYDVYLYNNLTTMKRAANT